MNTLFLTVTSSRARKATSRKQFEYFGYVEGSLLVSFEDRINTEFMGFTGLKDTFPMLFIISTNCRNLVTLQQHPKHNLHAKEKWPLILFFKNGSHMSCVAYLSVLWKLAVINERNKSRGSFKKKKDHRKHSALSSTHMKSPWWLASKIPWPQMSALADLDFSDNCKKLWVWH